MSTLVRRARIDDLPALLDLLDELQEGATPGIPWDRGDALWTATVWEEVLTDPRRVYIVAEEDERVVGTVDLIIVPNLTHGARPIGFVESTPPDAFTGRRPSIIVSPRSNIVHPPPGSQKPSASYNSISIHENGS